MELLDYGTVHVAPLIVNNLESGEAGNPKPHTYSGSCWRHKANHSKQRASMTCHPLVVTLYTKFREQVMTDTGSNDGCEDQIRL